MKKSGLIPFVLLGFIVFTLTVEAEAGVITVTGAQPDTSVSVTLYESPSSGLPDDSKTATVDANGNATVTFSREQQDAAIKISKGYLPRGKLNRVSVTESVNFAPGDLPNLEPFQLPNFVPEQLDVLLMIQIDLLAFLNSGVTFAVGDLVTSTGGAIPQSAAITFPSFTGDLRVTSFDQFDSVPEPSTYLLFGTGLLGILGYAWRQRKLNG